MCTGPFTCPTGAHSHGFISTSSARKEGKDWPDLQIYLSGAGVYTGIEEDFSSLSNLRVDDLENYFSDINGKDSFFMVINLARVKSSGELRLADKKPDSQPVIDPRYLENPNDLKVLVEGNSIVNKKLSHFVKY